MRKYIAIWILAVMLGGCDDFLTVQPKSDIKDSDLFKTPEGCEDAIYGAYSNLGTDEVYGRMMRYYLPEALAQSYNGSNLASALTDMMDYNHDLSDPKEVYATAWAGMYTAIGYVNDIVTNVEKYGKDFKYHDCYLGEALGMRAFMHFDLVRLFAPSYTSKPDAQAIPYVTRWMAKVTPFSTVKEVYGKILSDLRESERLLVATEKIIPREDENFMKKRNLHFNLDAARATLARVYLTIGNLDSARFYAEQVILSKRYELAENSEMPNLMAFVVSGKEAIWGIEQRDPMTDLTKYFYTLGTGLRPRTDISSFYVSGGTDNDLRGKWFRSRKFDDGDAAKITYFLKFFDEDHYYNPSASPYKGTPGLNMIRISEMYLIAAEGWMEDDPAKATAYFDQMSTSRGRPSLKDAGKTVTLKDINEERYREFFGEGQEWFNMKRQHRDLLIYSKQETVPGTDELYTITIPDDEFDYRYMDEEE